MRILNEKEVIDLIREVKERFPNEFHETIGFMKGLSIRDYKEKKEINKLKPKEILKSN